MVLFVVKLIKNHKLVWLMAFKRFSRRMSKQNFLLYFLISIIIIIFVCFFLLKINPHIILKSLQQQQQQHTEPEPPCHSITNLIDSQKKILHFTYYCWQNCCLFVVACCLITEGAHIFLLQFACRLFCLMGAYALCVCLIKS